MARDTTPTSPHVWTPALQLKVTPVKVFVIHIEAQTEDGNVHRVSISNMYSSESLKVRMTASASRPAPVGTLPTSSCSATMNTRQA